MGKASLFGGGALSTQVRGDVKEQNSGPADNNDNVGSTPEANNNGTDQTPGGGGGGGTHETGTTTPGTVPGTTPNTVPPTTTPNTVPPTTAPPTTIKPKGENPGCPPAAPCN